MKKSKRILIALSLSVLLLSALCVPAFAITESEVEAQVAASGREAVTGNVLLWFLCAVAFLKVSQKIDSFMAALGVNVGRTGGSMLAEAMIAMRTVTMVMGGGRGAGRAGSAAGSTAGRSGSSGMAGFFKGGLIGMAGRSVTNSAVKSAVTNTSNLHTAQSQVQQTAAIQAAAEPAVSSEVHVGGDTAVYAFQAEKAAGNTAGCIHTKHSAQAAHTAQTTHTASSIERGHTSRFQTGAEVRPTLGGMVFSHSLAAGGSFANRVIGVVARGETAGSITGDMAVQSLSSYMGCASPEAGGQAFPAYSEVEIGQGRITGVETAAGIGEGLPFAMYHVDQYTAPAGEYTQVVSADGAQWYKQYAVDAVERKPYMAPDDTVAYHERIIKKLPDPPKRKDRI